MKIVVESFVIMLTLFTMCLFVMMFLNKALITTKTTRDQKILQILYAISLVLNLLYNYYGLFHAYNNEYWEYDSFYKMHKFKAFQIFNELLVRAVLIFEIGILLSTIPNTANKNAKTMSTIIYPFLRLIPAIFIIRNLTTNYSLAVVTLEIISIGESIILALIFIGIIIQSNNQLNLLNTEFSNARFYVETLVEKARSICRGLFIHSILDIIYRTGFLFISIYPENTYMLILKDSCNLLRIGSLILFNLKTIELLFYDLNVDQAEQKEITEVYNGNCNKVAFFSYSETEECNSDLVLDIESTVTVE